MFESTILSLAQTKCNSTMLYPLICDNVANQPPYICSRNVYLPFFTILSTAIANAHILTVIFLLTAGWLLPRLCGDGQSATEDSATGQEKLSEMRTNPMNSINDL
jgi:hypothetical protein